MNSVNKIGFFKASSRSFQDIYWMLIPFIALGVVLTVLKNITALAVSPDLILLASLLFGESTSKVKEIDSPDKDEDNALYLIGISAFVVSISLWTFFLIINYGEIKGFEDFIDLPFLYIASCIALTLSFVYAMWVRIQIHRKCGLVQQQDQPDGK